MDSDINISQYEKLSGPAMYISCYGKRLTKQKTMMADFSYAWQSVRTVEAMKYTHAIIENSLEGKIGLATRKNKKKT